ncbi:MAG: elongation factor P [Candidatus Colwellbacteria bacterium]|nr:elongation factor P [Candidatus Colwellbacteria bacterium]
MSLSINDLKKGKIIILPEGPHAVLEVSHLHMGRGGAVVQTKLRQVKTGRLVSRNFKPGDKFEEAELERVEAEFVYAKRDEYWFHEKGKPANRFRLGEEDLGASRVFLKPKMNVIAFRFDKEGEIFSIELPIKAEYRVIEAPPAIRGSTAAGGTKIVTIEGGAKINVPLFVDEGDIVRINTQTGEYAERV